MRLKSYVSDITFLNCHWHHIQNLTVTTKPLTLYYPSTTLSTSRVLQVNVKKTLHCSWGSVGKWPASGIFSILPIPPFLTLYHSYSLFIHWYDLSSTYLFHLHLGYTFFYCFIFIFTFSIYYYLISIYFSYYIQTTLSCYCCNRLRVYLLFHPLLIVYYRRYLSTIGLYYYNISRYYCNRLRISIYYRLWALTAPKFFSRQVYYFTTTSPLTSTLATPHNLLLALAALYYPDTTYTTTWLHTGTSRTMDYLLPLLHHHLTHHKLYSEPLKTRVWIN